MINREDIYLYVTFTLAGAGIGLLVGSYLASKKNYEVTEIEPETYEDKNAFVDDKPDLKEVISNRYHPSSKLDDYLISEDDEEEEEEEYEFDEDDFDERSIYDEEEVFILVEKPSTGRVQKLIYKGGEDDIIYRVVGKRKIQQAEEEVVKLIGNGTFDMCMDTLLSTGEKVVYFEYRGQNFSLEIEDVA